MMSFWTNARTAAIQKGLKRRGVRKVLAKHADSSKNNIWRAPSKPPSTKQIPKWSNTGVQGLARFA